MIVLAIARTADLGCGVSWQVPGGVGFSVVSFDQKESLCHRLRDLHPTGLSAYVHSVHRMLTQYQAVTGFYYDCVLCNI